MFGTYFYNETFKRAVSIFGTLFNNITIKKTESDGDVLTEQKVPISYGPKQLFLARIEQDSKARDGNISAISLPRMSFEMTEISYDSTRQQNKLIRSVKSNLESGNTTRKFQYAPAPYNISFSLSVYVKNVTDGLQIVEQILPYFQPEYTVTMRMIDSMSDTRDVPIILDSVSMEDTYEVGFTERRVIEYTLNFTMKLYFFGPVNTSGIITSVIERDYISSADGEFTTTQIDASGLIKEVKSYRPAYAEVLADDVDNTTELYFDTAINTNISVGDEVFISTPSDPNFKLGDVVTIDESLLSVSIDTSVTVARGTTVKFVGSVQPDDTFIITEDVTFYDESSPTNFSEDTESDS